MTVLEVKLTFIFIQECQVKMNSLAVKLTFIFIQKSQVEMTPSKVNHKVKLEVKYSSTFEP